MTARPSREVAVRTNLDRLRAYVAASEHDEETVFFCMTSSCMSSFSENIGSGHLDCPGCSATLSAVIFCHLGHETINVHHECGSWLSRFALVEPWASDARTPIAAILRRWLRAPTKKLFAVPEAR